MPKSLTFLNHYTNLKLRPKPYAPGEPVVMDDDLADELLAKREAYITGGPLPGSYSDVVTVGEISDTANPAHKALVALIEQVAGTGGGGGVTDHGSTSGTVSLGGGSHELDLAGNTTITLTSSLDVTLFLHGTGQTLTVAGEVFTVDGDATILVVTSPRGVSTAYLAGGGGEPAVEDTTPPTAVTNLVATGGEQQIALSWTAATDTESAVSYRHRAWLTSGGAAGVWTTTTDTTATITGLASGAYTVEVYAYSAGGASATATATATATAPAGWSAFLSDAFTGADGTLAGHVPNVTPDSTAWTTGNPDYVAIEGNRCSQPDAVYNPSATLNIPSHTASLGLAVDLDLWEIGDSSQPIATLTMRSPSNNEDLSITLSRQGGGTVSIAAAAGNGGGSIALTGTTTGHPDAARYGFRWKNDRSLEVLVNGTVVATGTTAAPTYARDFTAVRISVGSFKASYFDNLTVEDHT